MSRSDKGDRPRKRFRHTVGRGSSTFSFNLCTQKTAAFPRQSKKIALAPAPSLCFRRRRRSPPQQAILVPNGAQTAVPSKTSNKKYPAASCEVFCGAPCGSKPEHFCVSGRHWHHAAAHPQVMPVVPPREDKRGMLKYQGAFAAYPRSTSWAAVFHSPLDISPSLFFRLIAEQPTSPYPDGIT